MRFTNSYRKIAKLKHKNKVIQGSQGGGKTYNILIRWILKALYSDEKQICSIVTSTFPALRDGALKDFLEICENNNIVFSGTKHPSVYKIRKWTFQFFSIDKENKGLGGRRDRLFINEANRIDWKIARHLINRTHRERIFDFNPVESFWAHEQFVDVDDCDFLKLTYKDNELLPKAEIEGIEKHAPWGTNPDPNYWRVFGLGEIGFVEGVIFPNYETFEELPQGRRFKTCYALDFGWNDPMGCVRVDYDKFNSELYVTEIFYSPEATHEQLVNAIKNDPHYRKQIIVCDSQGLREIMDLRKSPYGLNTISCDKSAGLVSDYRRLKKNKLFIHKSSKNLLELELPNHKWKEVKGRFIEYPEDDYNHLIDPIRYGNTFLMNNS